MEDSVEMLIKYEGFMADFHALDATRFGVSIQGIAGLYSKVATFVAKGFVIQNDSSLEVRLCVKASKEGSYELVVAAAFIGVHQEIVISLLSQSYIWFIGKVMQFVHDDAKGETNTQKTAEDIINRANQDDGVAEILANGYVESNKQLISLLEKLTADGDTKSLVRESIAPVGVDCVKMSYFGVFNTSLGDAEKIRSNINSEVGKQQSYKCEKILMLDTDTRECRIQINGFDQPVSASITDPAFFNSDNKYLRAFSNRAPLIISAKPVLQGDTILRLYVSDAHADV